MQEISKERRHHEEAVSRRGDRCILIADCCGAMLLAMTFFKEKQCVTCLLKQYSR
jgi:hypothetical protein